MSENEIVTRRAPNWAWSVIDEVLHQSCRVETFDDTRHEWDHRQFIRTAVRAMVHASEHSKIQHVAEADLPPEQAKGEP